MIIAKGITPIKSACNVGDLVQYNNKVCLVAKLENRDNPTYEYGLILMSGDEYKEGCLIVKNMSLWDIQHSIQGVLIKHKHLVASRIKDFNVQDMVGIPSKDNREVLEKYGRFNN